MRVILITLDGCDLGERATFADIAALFHLPPWPVGTTFLFRR